MQARSRDEQREQPRPACERERQREYGRRWEGREEGDERGRPWLRSSARRAAPKAGAAAAAREGRNIQGAQWQGEEACDGGKFVLGWGGTCGARSGRMCQEGWGAGADARVEGGWVRRREEGRASGLSTTARREPDRRWSEFRCAGMETRAARRGEARTVTHRPSDEMARGTGSGRGRRQRSGHRRARRPSSASVLRSGTAPRAMR